MPEHDSHDFRPIARVLCQGLAALDLGLVDPPLRRVVAITNRSNWLRTEFSCSGLPEDHANNSEGLPRRCGSYTRGEMYIVYSCAWPQMSRALEAAISDSRKYKLALTIRFTSWSDALLEASTTEPLARFAIAVSYEPANRKHVHQTLSGFRVIAAPGTEWARAAT